MPRRALRIAVAGPCTGVLLVLGLAACGTPVAYHDPGDIPEGPGMFTGEEGALRYSTDDGGSAEMGAEVSAAGDCECPEAEELEAYREFLRWKAEAVGTPEYQEFRDWRRWRREREE